MLEELLKLKGIVARCEAAADSRVGKGSQANLFPENENDDVATTVVQLRLKLLTMAYGPDAGPRFAHSLIHTCVELVRMIDGLGKYIQLSKHTLIRDRDGIYSRERRLQAELGRLFSWINREFKTQMPLNLVLPARITHDNRKYTEHLRRRLKTRFEKVIDEKLLAVLLKPLYKFSRLRCGVTVEYFRNIFTYQRQLKNLASNKSATENDVHSFLLVLSFQKKYYFDYRIKCLVEKVLSTNTASAPALVELYSYELKCTRQACCSMPGDHAGRLLITWLEAEIVYQERLLKTSNANYNDSNVTGNPGKIHLGLSAEELGFAIHLLMEEKIILDRNKTQVVKKVADSFGTIKTSNLSADSLENKLYQVEEATRLKVKARVFALLDRIREYKR